MKLAIIGGSLCTQVKGLTGVTDERVKTPFGEPSSNLFMGKVNGLEIVYLNRHGTDHTFQPHQINYRANMFALKLLDVTHIIAIAAVGGITRNMSPLTCVVPDQLIDYTYGRMQSYNDGYEGDVTHIDFSYPYDNVLRYKLSSAAARNDIDCEVRATYGVTQGPRLETVAEIKRMRRDGCHIVGMTGMPEASLARELDMDYANLSLVVNWAAGADLIERKSNGQKHLVVSMDEIKKYIIEGNKIIDTVLSTTIASIAV